VRVTVPAPVVVTFEPDTVAGPLTTVYVIAPEDAEDALTVTLWPKPTEGMLAKTSCGAIGVTVKLVVAVAAL
jgi:hypothetical protein